MNFGTRGCMYCEGECNKECLSQEEPKQETLEEQMYRASFENESPLWHDGFIAGGKYMTERMYSEEEVQLILSKLLTDIKNGNAGNSVKWFKQFKKK